MLKIIGYIIVFFTITLFGFFSSFKLKKRCQSLERLIKCLTKISTETAFSKKRIQAIFTNISREFDMPVFFEIAIKMNQLGIEDAISTSFLKYQHALALSSNDLDCINGLSDVFMICGRKQQKSIDSVIKLLNLSFEDAKSIYDKNSKLLRNGSVLCGLLAVVLMF